MKMAVMLLIAAFLVEAAPAFAVEETDMAEQPAAAHKHLAGLTRAPGGAVFLNGEAFRGIGMQYHDCFSRRLINHKDTSYREGFRELASYGVPFVRFQACGFYASEMRQYLDDKDAYFAIMDDVVATAKENGVGLMPSLFWWLACVPDLVGEPVNQWGNPESKTRAFMREYTTEMVTRYKDSPAIYAWEFGNEYNLAMDLPNAMDVLPAIVPHLGTPESRSEKDVLTFDMVHGAFVEFAETVRRYDPNRLISTGNAVSRPSSHHQRIEGTWAPDSKEEFLQHLIDVNPDPMDTISVHVYPGMLEEGYFGKERVTYEELMYLCMKAAEKSGKVLFLGEFGAPDNVEGGRELARIENRKLFEAILATGVPLSSYWVYDFSHQDHFINVTSTNHRSYVLDMVKKANQTLRAAGN